MKARGAFSGAAFSTRDSTQPRHERNPQESQRRQSFRFPPFKSSAFNATVKTHRLLINKQAGWRTNVLKLSLSKGDVSELMHRVDSLIIISTDSIIQIYMPY